MRQSDEMVLHHRVMRYEGIKKSEKYCSCCGTILKAFFIVILLLALICTYYWSVYSYDLMGHL